MFNTYLYTRMLAEDVQAAELKITYNKTRRKQARPAKTIINKKEVLAETIYNRMMAEKAGQASQAA